jgi:hypothetical protein
MSELKLPFLQGSDLQRYPLEHQSSKKKTKIKLSESQQQTPKQSELSALKSSQVSLRRDNGVEMH